jgi:hypothetical protein
LITEEQFLPEPKSKPEGMAPRGGKHVCAYDDKMKIVPQDDQFLDKEPWDFRNTPGDHYPLLLFCHPLKHLPETGDQAGGRGPGHVLAGRRFFSRNKEAKL